MKDLTELIIKHNLSKFSEQKILEFNSASWRHPSTPNEFPIIHGETIRVGRLKDPVYKREYQGIAANMKDSYSFDPYFGWKIYNGKIDFDRFFRIGFFQPEQGEFKILKEVIDWNNKEGVKIEISREALERYEKGDERRDNYLQNPAAILIIGDEKVDKYLSRRKFKIINTTTEEQELPLLKI